MLVLQRHVRTGCGIGNGNKVTFAMQRRTVSLLFQFGEQIRELL